MNDMSCLAQLDMQIVSETAAVTRPVSTKGATGARMWITGRSCLQLLAPDEVGRHIDVNGRVLEIVLRLRHENLDLRLTPAKNTGEDG